jgi:hypothetical protein
MGTHSEECNHKPPEREAPCLLCHLDMKRKIKIRDSYRGVEGKREQDKNFDSLEKRLKTVAEVEIEKFTIDKDEYGIILFDNKKKREGTLKEIIKSEKCGFFGDRPAMYFFSHNKHDKKKSYVGESRNSFQRLERHRGKKEILNGGIVINTTKEKTWGEDPLNTTNVRLVLERMLKHLVYTHTGGDPNPRIDKWVTCTKDEEDTARKLAEGIYERAEKSKLKKYWRHLVDTKKKPSWSPCDVPAWYKTPKKTRT